MEALQKLHKEGEFDVQLTMLYDLVGEFFKDLGQYKLARLSFEKSLELKESHVEPEDITLQQSYFSLGKLFTQWKKFQTAEDYLKQALDVKEESGEQQQPSVTYALILESFAALYMMQEKSNEADMCRKNAAGNFFYQWYKNVGKIDYKLKMDFYLKEKTFTTAWMTTWCDFIVIKKQSLNRTYFFLNLIG